MDEKDIESDGAHLGELLLEVIELREQLLLGLRAKFVSLDLLSDCEAKHHVSFTGTRGITKRWHATKSEWERKEGGRQRANRW